MSKPGEASKSTLHMRRLAWLRRNRHQWSDYNESSWIEVERRLLELMKKAKLYPITATLLDVSIDKLINKVRASGRPKKMLYRSE